MKKKKLLMAIIQSILGIIFLYAGVGKLFFLKDFVKAIENYRLFPDVFFPIIGISIPIIEIILGTFLILNIYSVPIMKISIIILTIFSLAIIQAILRGIDLNCGCFAQQLMLKEIGKIVENKVFALLKNIFFILAFIFLIRFKKTCS